MMTDTVNVLDNYAAVLDSNRREPEVVAQLLLYQIKGDIAISRDELAQLLSRYAFSERYLPPAINPKQRFTSLLRVLPTAKERTIEIGSASYTLEFVLGEERVGGALLATLIRRRELSGGKWDNVEVAYVAWDPKEPLTVGYAVESGHETEYPYLDLLETFAEQFERRCQLYTGNEVGRVISAILSDTTAIRVRATGGEWIVPREQFDLLDRLAALVKEMDTYRPLADSDGTTSRSQPSDWDTLDLMDRPKDVHLLRSNVLDQVIDMLDRATRDLREMAQRDTPPKPQELTAAAKVRADAIRLRNAFSTALAGDADVINEALGAFADALDTVTLPASAPSDD